MCLLLALLGHTTAIPNNINFLVNRSSGRRFLFLLTYWTLGMVGYSYWNARIFRETKSRDRKFPDGTFQDRKILGPENSRNSIFSRNSRNIFLRKFQDFFLLEQKIPGLLTLLNSWTTNSVTEFSRTFFTFLSL